MQADVEAIIRACVMDPDCPFKGIIKANTGIYQAGYLGTLSNKKNTSLFRIAP